MSRLVSRLDEEFRSVLPPTIFFFVMLHIVAVIRVLMLKGTGIPANTWWQVTISALILGKSVLIADHLPVINRYPDKPLAYNVAWKTLIYVVVATLIHYLERLLDVWGGAGSLAAANRQLLAAMVWPHFIAIEILLLVLILAYNTMHELVRVIGKDKVLEMFFGWRALGLLLLALLTSVDPASAARGSFPSTVETIDGESLDLEALSQRHTLVVVTLKSTGCPVCRRQLERIQARLDELRSCGVSFVVLSPGPRDELARIRDETGFPYPFVEDRDLAIASRLGLRLGESEIQPSILILDDDLSIGWVQRGRSSEMYGDAALAEKVSCWLTA